MKKVCPKCGSKDYIIIKTKNNIVQYFLCVCLYSGDIKKLKIKNLGGKFKKIWKIIQNILTLNLKRKE